MFMVNQFNGFGSGSLAAPIVTHGTAALATVAAHNLGTNDGSHGGLQFTSPATGTVLSATLDVSSVVSTQNWHAELWTNNAGNPGTQIGVDSASQSVSTGGVKTFTFGTPPAVTASTLYWMVFVPEGSAADIIAVNVTADNASYGSGRSNTITGITTTGFTSSRELKVELSIQT